jgi:two-component system NtrC family sensor kinase
LGPAPSVQENVERFRDLSYELLKFSTLGLLRRDFLPMVSETIMAHAGCDAIELWAKDDSTKHFRCEITGSIKMPFGFILVPCPLGEETSSSLGDRDELSMEGLCCDVVRGETDRFRANVSSRGGFWTGETPGTEEEKIPETGTSMRLPGSYKSLAVLPIRIEDECIGILQLKSKKTNYFSAPDINFYEDISDILGIALSHQYAQIELRERIKEISCLYGIARVVARTETSLDEVMQGIADLLPPAWLFPEIAAARIVLNGYSWTTNGFRATPHRQVSDIIINGQILGFVEVVYLEKKLTLDEGPFLNEERSLIDSVAREVAHYYEHTRASEEKSSLQEQLRHADRLATIGQLAAGVAHELNEPLGNILGFAQLARKTPELTEQVEKDLGNIESASLHAREIIKKLMMFARQLPPKTAPVNLNNIVTDSVYFFEARSLKADIQLVCKLDPDLPRITVDPGQINQVLVNLVVNAIQAMPDGGKLTIETRLTGDEICLIVEDTGTGISEDLTKQIFLPFFTTKDINEGTGLGLAVVHGIISSHRGRIAVESEPRKGSRFLIYLPLTGSKQRNEKIE